MRTRDLSPSRQPSSSKPTPQATSAYSQTSRTEKVHDSSFLSSFHFNTNSLYPRVFFRSSDFKHLHRPSVRKRCRVSTFPTLARDSVTHRPFSLQMGLRQQPTHHPRPLASEPLRRPFLVFLRFSDELRRAPFVADCRLEQLSRRRDLDSFLPSARPSLSLSSPLPCLDFFFSPMTSP